MKDEKIIKDMLKNAQNYFGKGEKIYIYKCTKCKNMILSQDLLSINN